jgi:hypothetical protein
MHGDSENQATSTGAIGRAKRRGVRLACAFAVTATALALFAASAPAAVPSLFAQVPEDGQPGSAAGRIQFGTGIVADPNLPGHVYVADSSNNRIDEYTAWGEFVKAWGWGVKDGKAEPETCTTQTGCQKGLTGSGPGQFKNPSAVALDGAGNVYVFDRGNISVLEFSSAGAFLRAFGGDVVGHGPDDSTNDEVQTVTVAASGGTFKLSFEAPFGGGGTAQTAALPHNASAAEVQSALNGLASIGGISGSVAVTGGPGDPTGSNPYVVTFEGNLGGDDVPPLQIDSDALGSPAGIGYSLECGTQKQENEINEVVATDVDHFQWLRNGVPIPGATAATYTVTAADEGTAIQCQGFATNPTAGTTSVARPAYVVAPAPAEPLPVPPNSSDLGVQAGSVGAAKGNPHTCPTESWKNATSFSFSWYRNGVLIPGATAATYTPTEADLASAAAFQCVISGANAGGTAVAISTRLLYTTPEPPFGLVPPAEWATMSPPTRVSETHRGGASEVCIAAAGDVCKAARRPGTADQLGEGQGLRSLAIDSAGTVFVAEGEAIKVFEAGGAFRESIAMPEGMPVDSGIATDASGDLYVSSGTKVRKLEPHGPLASFIAPSFEDEPEPPYRVAAPGSLALDGAGNLYVVVRNPSGEGEPKRVLEFDPSGKCLDCKSAGEGGKPGFDRASSAQGTDTEMRGIAAGSACGSDGVYVLQQENTGEVSIKIFGDPPNPQLCPQPHQAPNIRSQYATSVTGSEAELQARINSRFWNDTTFKVEYGTAPCFKGGCTETAARRLTSKVVNAYLKIPAVLLEGLEPATTYHYRFVAQSSGGGPVYGVDPDGEGPGEASFEEGEERIFTTSRTPGVREPCPDNEAFRSGPAALLPDCRAYEMVSPLDKENADISVLTELAGAAPAVLNQSSTDGGKLTFGSVRSFGGAVSAPLTSQYVATRGEGGWVTHPISPSLEGEGETVALDTEFWSFSPDLCESWVLAPGEPVLAPGAQPETPNLYRRTDSECGGSSYEALSTAPGYGHLALQGISADGSAAIYIADGPLTEEGEPTLGESTPQLYYRQGAQTRFVCILPDGEASQKPCAPGGSLAGNPLTNGSHYNANVAGAISADGQRVFWEAGGIHAPLYLRENPGQPQSALAHGGAGGTGKLTEKSTGVTALVAAKGKASLTEKSPIAILSETSIGKFVAGQPVSGTGIGAGTTIVKIEGNTLTLSAAATATKSPVTLTSNGPMPFAVGQTISAPGVPAGTTITAIKAGELKLSKAAMVTESGTPLEATSECTEVAKACTLTVSREAEEETGSNASTYWGAARDGSVAVFETGGNAYEFNVDTRTTHLIAHKAAGGFVGMSEDASRIYLASEEVLTGPNDEGLSPVVGKRNLYLYEASGQFHFIGALEGPLGPSAATLTDVDPFRHAARVSADGHHATFISSASLTDYDNTDTENEEADAEVFLYDASANGGQGKLICASCNPSGARPLGSRDRLGRYVAAWIPTYENIFYASRVLSEEGNRLFFNSFDPLLPRDTNGRADVYEWEAPGRGTCEEESPSYSPQNGGCIALISSGKSLTNSEFVDASPNGEDAFFTTVSSFDPRDTGLIDIYDARVGGGFPAPQSPPAACEGEACQSAPEPPNDQTPSSLSFEGAGNVREEAASAPTSTRCAKGKVKRHGRRCVAKKHKHAHRRAKRNRGAGR